MSRKSKRVCFSPDVNEKPTIFLKYYTADGSAADGGGVRVLASKRRIIGNWTSQIPKARSLSPVRFLARFGEKVAKAVRGVSMRRKSSPKVSSSSMARSVSLSDHTDSHRAEAVEACIEFLHSSSTRERPI